MMPEIVENNRDPLLDFLKGIACIGVVFIHVEFPGMVGDVISKLSQFAVPVFFMIAGYYGVGCSEKVIKGRLFKILKVFIYGYFWFFAYNIVLQLKQNTLIEWLTLHYTYKAIIKCLVFCTIDFAIPLWYLIAMIETYLLWLVVVKNKKELQFVKYMPFLFLFQVILTTICETNNFSWFWKINFLTRALPWFLFGYYVHSLVKIRIEKSRDAFFIFTAIVGGIIALIPILFDTYINFSSAGLILYSISIFVVAIKHPEKTLFRPIVYIGNKLSLNIYIFHVLMGSVITFIVSSFFMIDTEGHLFLWIKPLITLTSTILFALVIEKINRIIKNRSHKDI